MNDLTGQRVLIVEDDYMIASDLADMLHGVGVIAVGPVGWAADGLAIAADASQRLDAAILDVNLNGTASYGIADALVARGIRIVFTTGFSADALDPAYRHHPRLEKPISVLGLLAALAKHG